MSSAADKKQQLEALRAEHAERLRQLAEQHQREEIRLRELEDEVRREEEEAQRRAEEERQRAEEERRRVEEEKRRAEEARRVAEEERRVEELRKVEEIRRAEDEAGTEGYVARVEAARAEAMREHLRLKPSSLRTTDTTTTALGPCYNCTSREEECVRL